MIVQKEPHEWHPFVWENGALGLLPTFEGGTGWGWAHNVNDAGQIVGHSSIESGEARACIWESGTLRELTGLGGRGTAYSINESGFAAGNTHNADGNQRAVIWENGVPKELGTLYGQEHSSASSINDNNQVVGLAETDEFNNWHAFFWENDVMIDLGTLPGQDGSIARDINNRSMAVGQSYDDDNRHPVLWHDGVIQDLGTFGRNHGDAYSINDAGQIVGFSTYETKGERAFLWENGVMYDLNDLIPEDSGWILVEARAINETGSIVGWGLHDGQAGFLLTPIPEPSIIGLAGVGVVAGIGWWIRKQIGEVEDG